MSEETPESGSKIPESKAKSKPKPKPKPKRGLFRRLVMWLVLLVIAAGAGAAATVEHWRPYAETHIAAAVSKLNLPAAAPAQNTGQNAAQNELLAALTARVTALEQAQSAPASGAGAGTAALMQRIETLENALDDVRAMAAAAQASGGGDAGETPAAVTETFTRIDERLAALEIRTAEAAASAAPEGAAALMAALGDLRAAVAAGAPYQETLAAVTAVFDGAPPGAVAGLETCAASGAPAVSRLREDLRAAAREAARVRIAAAADEGWMGAVAAKASALVSVRRVDDSAAPESLDGRLARAERALESGDVAAAVRALEGLSGAPGAAVQPWLETARAHITCKDGLAAVAAAAAAWLSGG